MPGSTVIQPSLKDARHRLRADILRRIPEHDTSAIGCEFYAEDACLWSFQGMAFCGRDHVCGFWRAMLEAGLEDVRFEPSRIEEDTSLGYEVGRFELVRRPVPAHGLEEAPSPLAGNYLAIYRRHEDGGWRIVAEMYSPAGETTPRQGRGRMPERSPLRSRGDSRTG